MKKNVTDINWPKAVLTNIIDAIIAMDTNGIIRYINTSARKLINCSTPNIIGHHAETILTFTDGTNKEPIAIPSIKSFNNNTKTVILTRVTFINSTKKEITVNAVFTPIKSDHNTITGVALRFRDVTKMTLQDKKLWNEQKIKAIGTMAGGIADDFITWLDIIATHATAITDNVIPRTRAYEEASSIINTTKQAKGMTRRLMSVSKLATNHTDQPPDNINLNTTIKTAITQSKLIFNNDKIEFIPRYTHAEASILANETILTDCIINIFRNAIDAMPDGGKITIDVTKSRNSSYTNHIVLRIRDTGIGMDKNTLEKSCDPFFSTKNKTIGMGLGLTIVKTFTQNYGGDIRIQSKKGIGTSVRLFLPLNNKIPNSENINTANHTATILAVDNNKETLNEIKSILENTGNTVHIADNAEDALEIYKKNRKKIGIIIIDMIMPEKDGRYLFDSITGLTPKASIIITSGFPRSYVRDRIKTGGWHFIQKPINKDHLISTIERILK